MGEHTMIEQVHVSRLGPPLRAVVSRALTPWWVARGRPAPAPPHRKRRIIADHARRFHPSAFVETGTFRGDTIAAVHHLVPRTISIELDERLTRLARARFAGAPDVTIRQGDSAVELPGVVAEISEPALFWLDGHHSDGVTALGDRVSPIEDELATVLDASRPDHIVLIDDARLFTGSGGYPTLERVRTLVAQMRPTWSFTVEDDIIRTHVARAAPPEARGAASVDSPG